MRGKAMLGLAAALALLPVGCGTVANCTNWQGRAPLTVYGGVKEDIVSGTDHLHEAFGGPCPSFSAVTHMPSTAEQVMMRSFCAGCGVCMLALDMPISIVADTLTLPITIPATLARKPKDHPRKRKAAPAQASAPTPPKPPSLPPPPPKMTTAAPSSGS